MRIGSLFSGAGGLDLAVAEVFGGEIVWHAEIDKAASKVLAHRFPGVPNLGDVSQVNWANWKPMLEVDVLCGGFPCQDVSAAGKRAGIKQGTRSGLWSVFAEAIDALRPQWVVIENVRGLLSATAHRTVEDDESGGVESPTAALGDGAGRPVLRAAGAVLGDLAERGYDAQWTTLAASAVGAPHRRERVFILARAADATFAERRRAQQQPVGASIGSAAEHRERASSASWRHGDVADAPRYGWDEGRAESARLIGGPDAAVSRDGDVALLPTPCVVDRLATGEMTLEEWDESRRSQKERGVGSFGPRGDSLGAAVLRVEEGSERPDYSTTKARGSRREDGDVALLPTPRSSDCFGAGLHGDGGMDLRTTVTLLPTPNTFDGGGSTLHPDRRKEINPKHSPELSELARHELSAWGKYESAIRRWEAVVGPAPAPTEPNKNGNPRLSAAFSEWLMGWPAGWVTDPAIGISRNDQLRIVGNGVCPQQAMSALRFLLGVAAGTHTHTQRERADVTLLPTPCSRDHKDGDSAAVHARNTPSLGAVSKYFGE